jgi:signal transduction histidine kinase
VDCPPLPEPVYVDRDMWEKLVLNRLSNAFKFTMEGEIAVTLRPVGKSVALSVRATGTAIPPQGLPRLFERFYRVPSIEQQSGSGMGLGLGLDICRTIVPRARRPNRRRERTRERIYLLVRAAAFSGDRGAQFCAA